MPSELFPAQLGGTPCFAGDGVELSGDGDRVRHTGDFLKGRRWNKAFQACSEAGQSKAVTSSSQ
jgi:hypothetical protein